MPSLPIVVGSCCVLQPRCLLVRETPQANAKVDVTFSAFSGLPPGSIRHVHCISNSIKIAGVTLLTVLPLSVLPGSRDQYLCLIRDPGTASWVPLQTAPSWLPLWAYGCSSILYSILLFTTPRWNWTPNMTVGQTLGCYYLVTFSYF